MNCFPCFSSRKSDSNEEQLPVAQPKEAGNALLSSHADGKHIPSNDLKVKEGETAGDIGSIAAKYFTFRELAAATKNFRQECLISDDGFGRVYKGTLQSSGQIVAVKQMDRNGMQGSKEFLAEVCLLSNLKHPNLLNFVGYCADGDQRVLVYEYMPMGSLETHLLDKAADKKVLDWTTRMKIASGAAQGLEYLHETANPPVIYRDFKSSNVLLDEEYNPKLCDFGLAKPAQSGNKSNVPPRVMGTYGYSAPEYARTGELTLKSDIYSFGVVLLELITGRRAIDPNRPANEQNLVTWAQPIFREPKRFPEMADPLLNNNFSVKSLNQAVGVAAMCLQEEPTVRPFIADVVAALSFLELEPKDVTNPATAANLPTQMPCSAEIETSKDASCDETGDNIDSQSETSSSDQEDNGNSENQQSDGKHVTENEDGYSSSEKGYDNDDDHVAHKTGGKSIKSRSQKDTVELSDHESMSREKCATQKGSVHDDEDEDDEEEDDDDDDLVPQKSRTKSIRSRSKKGKVELSDDESMYSSSSSSSSSISGEIGDRSTIEVARPTTQS